MTKFASRGSYLKNAYACQLNFMLTFAATLVLSVIMSLSETFRLKLTIVICVGSPVPVGVM